MIKHMLAAGLLVMALPTQAEAKGPNHCPPGLAKKTPACVPPGQAKKGSGYDRDRDAYHRDRDDEDRYRDGDRYSDLRVGDRVILEGREYVVVSVGTTVVLRRDDSLYRLPRIGDGSDYVRVGDVIVKVDRKTRAIFDIIELADLILS